MVIVQFLIVTEAVICVSQLSMAIRFDVAISEKLVCARDDQSILMNLDVRLISILRFLRYSYTIGFLSILLEINTVRAS